MTYIGIDTGKNTGVAIYVGGCKSFDILATVKIHKAMEMVRQQHATYGKDLLVVLEDARQRRWIPDTGDLRREMGRRQGAGSIKRDAQIWEDFLTDEGIAFELRKPSRGLTKWSAETFARLTGYRGRTSEHARDAALLVWGRK